MTAWLVLVVLLLPSSQGGQPLRGELQVEVIGATSLAACLRHAEQLAQAQRAAHAEFLARTGARIAGECRPIKKEPSA